eukprot:Protomagalhaensia_wolfi_Nauph_80__2633@NODE_2776_length_991_cov_10_920168_g2177_i0_p1_GENE_NODE_2776_length_991_cov_10_920168_g2177_i0NODE_2776_length_991_cov_10_920168_g2177_i0_p1_ORF_typecomplete_len274_score73_67_NODE_2776_length_991_cov_10_920168_g2177_i0114935
MRFSIPLLALGVIVDAAVTPTFKEATCSADCCKDVADCQTIADDAALKKCQEALPADCEVATTYTLGGLDDTFACKSDAGLVILKTSELASVEQFKDVDLDTATLTIEVPTGCAKYGSGPGTGADLAACTVDPVPAATETLGAEITVTGGLADDLALAFADDADAACQPVTGLDSLPINIAVPLAGLGGGAVVPPGEDTTGEESETTAAAEDETTEAGENTTEGSETTESGAGATGATEEEGSTIIEAPTEGSSGVATTLVLSTISVGLFSLA